MAITRTFSPFLTFFQTDAPVIPFLAKDLTELMKGLLRRFVKKEVLKDISPLQLVRLDVSDKQSWVNLKEVNVGLGAESLLKELQKQKKIGELTVLEFRNDCVKVMCTIIQKVQDKSPLKYPVVRQVACLDPSMMISDPDWCKNSMTKLVQRSRYRMHLDQQKKMKVTDDQAKKRKALEDDIEDLKKKKRILVLQIKDADQLAEEAEGKAGTLMAHLITKSNTEEAI
ncbi:hypothetical protein DPX16_5242 [Anabarilius grahami]|uniref:Uncharacterized protein n=1 Tax=Anabarilius grahami TaxID=495550 RepID=A0A3N0Y2U4_ANAGA|nr:hypothetical protein DPX16_5242 [Anabarilius grahami]